MKSLNPTIPVLHIGVFRRFRAIAYVCIGASPNKVIRYFIHPECYLLFLMMTTESAILCFSLIILKHLKQLTNSPVFSQLIESLPFLVRDFSRYFPGQKNCNSHLPSIHRDPNHWQLFD